MFDMMGIKWIYSQRYDIRFLACPEFGALTPTKKSNVQKGTLVIHRWISGVYPHKIRQTHYGMYLQEVIIPCPKMEGLLPGP